MKKLFYAILFLSSPPTHCMLNTRILIAIQTEKVEEVKKTFVELYGNDTETIKKEINKVYYDWTPLRYAINYVDDFSVFKLLIQQGANPNDLANSTFQETPLLRACYYGKTRMINLLLACGAKTNVRTITSPLHNYIRSGLRPALSTLLKHGVDSRILDHRKKKAKDYLGFSENTYRTLLSKADTIRDLMDEHKFEEASEYLFEKEQGEHELFYNALFGLYSKESYDTFETTIKKRLRQFPSYDKVTNLQEWLERTVPPQLREHFLHWGIWQWQDRMYHHCTTLNSDQKKDLILYKYTNQAIANIEHDLKIIYLEHH